jgi:hypothetical protein
MTPCRLPTCMSPSLRGMCVVPDAPPPYPVQHLPLLLLPLLVSLLLLLLLHCQTNTA